jgi:hypothetical protein
MHYFLYAGMQLVRLYVVIRAQLKSHRTKCFEVEPNDRGIIAPFAIVNINIHYTGGSYIFILNRLSQITYAVLYLSQASIDYSSQLLTVTINT